MKEEYHKFYTMHLSCEFDMLVFGHGGIPVILFPTSQGRYWDNKDNGLIDSVTEQIEQGKIRIFCPDGIDMKSWYNCAIHPADRVKTYLGYENVILHDVIAYAKAVTGKKKVALAGCSLGAYYALNIGLKHPDKVNNIISMSGSYDIKQFMEDYYDDNVYYNNPPDYLPGLRDAWYISRIQKMGIFLGAGEWDHCLDETLHLSGLFKQKQILHRTDIFANADHDWPVWKKMFPLYINQLMTTGK